MDGSRGETFVAFGIDRVDQYIKLLLTKDLRASKMLVLWELLHQIL